MQLLDRIIPANGIAKLLGNAVTPRTVRKARAGRPGALDRVAAICFDDTDEWRTTADTLERAELKRLQIQAARNTAWASIKTLIPLMKEHAACQHQLSGIKQTDAIKAAVRVVTKGIDIPPYIQRNLSDEDVETVGFIVYSMTVDHDCQEAEAAYVAAKNQLQNLGIKNFVDPRKFQDARKQHLGKLRESRGKKDRRSAVEAPSQAQMVGGQVL